MDIKTVGTLLYWCEGSKRGRDRVVEFVNSDERMISVFMKYLRARNVDEKRIRIRMTLHIQDDESECKEFWKRITSLGDSNFNKTIIRNGGLVKKPLPHGTVTVRYHSIQLLRRINKEISELAESLQDSRVPAAAPRSFPPD